MRNKLKKITCLVLAVICMAGISVTAYASGGGEETAVPDAEEISEAGTDTGASASEENDTETQIPYSYTIDSDGSLVITINGDSEPTETTTIGTVVTGGSRLNLRTGAGMGYEVIDQLRPGEEVTVVGSEGDWYEVIVPEKRGYVYSDYLELAEKDGETGELDSDTLTYLLSLMFQGIQNTEMDKDGKSPLAFTPEGNLTLVDDFLQIEALATEDSEQLEKQFITLQSKNGNTFYLVIDRNGENENVYFMNLVDEADLMALMEDEGGSASAPVCTCTEKCAVGSINTGCEVCRTNMSECTGKEAVTEPEPETSDPAEEPEEEKSANFLPLLILMIAGAAGGAVYWFKFRKPKAKTSGNSDLDDYDYGQDDEDYDEETELDDADLMAETESGDKES